MNDLHTTSDFMTPLELALVTSDVTGLTSDPQTSVEVTYRDFQSRTLNRGTGAVVETYTDQSGLRGIRNSLSARQVTAGEGLYQMGDVKFMFSRSLLTLSPAREDRIVEGSATYELVSWDSDPLSALWNIVARVVK